MKTESYQDYLYLIDFGEYIKIGKSTKMFSRFKNLCRDSGLHPSFETSYVWKGDKKDIDAIEHWLRRTYKDKAIRTPISSRETFTRETSEDILYTIQQLRGVVALDMTQAKKLSDFYQFEGYEDGRIQIKPLGFKDKVS